MQDPGYIQKLHRLKYLWSRYHSALGYNIPSHSCLTLQFYPQENYFRRVPEHRRFCVGLKQTINPLNNHMVFRRDEGYIYPHKSNIRYVALSFLFPEFNISEAQRRYTLLDNISLTYVFGNHLDMKQHFQVDFKKQTNFTQITHCCKVHVNAPPVIYVPIKFIAEAAEVPENRSIHSDSAFSFGKYFFEHRNQRWRSWHKSSFSWVTSTIYHINCSRNAKTELLLSENDLHQTCITHSLEINLWQCLIPPMLGERTHSTSWVFTIKIPKTVVAQMNVLLLHFSTIINQLCHIKALETAEGQVPLLCTRYTVQTNVYASLLDRNHVYCLQFRIHELTKIKQHFNSSVMKHEQPERKSKPKAEYNWVSKQRQTLDPVEQNRYKLFFSSVAHSWIAAFIKCTSRGMCLPSFKSQDQLHNVAANFDQLHPVFPLAVFVALVRKVSESVHNKKLLCLTSLSNISFAFSQKHSFYFQAGSTFNKHLGGNPLVFFPWKACSDTQLINHHLQYLPDDPLDYYPYDQTRDENIIKLSQGGHHINQDEMVSPLTLINDDFRMMDQHLGKFKQISSSTECIILSLLSSLHPYFYSVDCHTKLVHAILCQQALVGSKSDALLATYGGTHATPGNSFKCSSGIFISIIHICDGKYDCIENLDDEVKCWCKLGDKHIMESEFCFTTCHPMNCTCPILFRQRSAGGCLLYIESQTKGTPSQLEYFECRNKVIIYKRLVNDLTPDCLNNEDEPQLLNTLVSATPTEYRCPEADMLECSPGHSKCYFTKQKCLYDIDDITNTLTTCRNGKHLENCNNVKCVDKLKCPKSYCMRYRYRCDGRWDCWDGYDEQSCSKQSLTCQGFFKCRQASTYIHINDICDGFFDCALEDDELMCQLENCKRDCTCLGLALVCTNATLDRQSLHSDLKHFVFINISFSLFSATGNFGHAVSLILPHNKLQKMFPILNGTHHELKYLDVSFNHIKGSGVEKHYLLHNLLALNLSHNLITELEHIAFDSVKNLHSLDLSHNEIHTVSEFAFSALPHLRILKFHSNILENVKISSFETSSLKAIVTNKFQMCCAVQTRGVACTAEPLWQSMCFRGVLGKKFFRVIFWFVMALAFVSNLASASFSMRCASVKKSSKNEAVIIFRTVVTALNSSDLMFCFYLFAIVLKDTSTDRKFIQDNYLWTRGNFCIVLASLSSFAVFLSCFLGVFLSVARYLAVKYALDNPLTHKRTLHFILAFIVLSFSFVFILIFSGYMKLKEEQMLSPLCVFFGDVSSPLPVAISTYFTVCLWGMSATTIPAVYIKLVHSAHKTRQEANMNNQHIKNKTIVHLRFHLAVSSIVNILCWVPAIILLILHIAGQTFSLIFHDLLLFLSLNPLLNSWILNYSDLKSFLLSLRQVPLSRRLQLFPHNIQPAVMKAPDNNQWHLWSRI